MIFDTVRRRVKDRGASLAIEPSQDMQIKPQSRKWLWIALGTVVAVLLIALGSGYLWYINAQRPVDMSNNELKTIRVAKGMGPSQIGILLKDGGVIRDTLAYRIYVKLQGIENKLQAGTYRIAPSESLSEVVTHLLDGKDETFSITFYPGATLRDPTDIADNERTDVYTILIRAGYTDAQVRTALGANYDSPLFQDKPSGTSLEGYVYGETYDIPATAQAEDILQYTFDTYYNALQKNSIIENAKRRGLNLYQAITLASIVQREVSGYEDMRKVAQVFYTRLEQGMALGSDVTFIYAAQQANRTPAVNFDSPYNTRIHAGLPPGPIATPGIDALRAVADPADTTYLFFVAGEDGKTYFARTEAEHLRNVANHCGDLCR